MHHPQRKQRKLQPSCCVTWSQLAFLVLATACSMFSGHLKVNLPRHVPHFLAPGLFLLDFLCLQAAPASYLCLSHAGSSVNLPELPWAPQTPPGHPVSTSPTEFSCSPPSGLTHTSPYARRLSPPGQGSECPAPAEPPAHSRNSINAPYWRNEKLHSNAML